MKIQFADDMILNRRELTKEEKAKPYAKFYYRELKTPDPELLKKFEQPMDWHNGMDSEEIKNILILDARDSDSGYCIMPDGTGYLAYTIPMPGVSLNMVKWWMAWHPLEDLRYMIWFPGSHYGIKVNDEDKKRLLDPDIEIDEKVKNITHFASEDIFVHGDDSPFFPIRFIDPADTGFDREIYESADDVFALVIMSEPGLAKDPFLCRIIIHFFRQTGNGVQLTTRTWRGCTIENGKKIVTVPEGEAVEAERMLPLSRHMMYEFVNLADILPDVYKMQKGKIEE